MSFNQVRVRAILTTQLMRSKRFRGVRIEPTPHWWVSWRVKILNNKRLQMNSSLSSHYLVPSKLSVPYLPANALRRERIEEAFVAACKLPLVVLCAPAGFGKTTAALHGFIALQDDEPEARMAWLSIDPEDTDPHTFAAYFVSAIAKQIRLSDQVLNSAIEDRSTQLKALFGQLLYELDRIRQRLIIMLDDYHLIESEEIHQAIAYFAKHLPPHVTLVLTTRSDPPASIMSLRLQGLVADMQADDLSFSVKETQSFFQQLGSGFHLEEDDAARLLEHVEGWAVGLQLIVLGLKSKPSFDDLRARLDHKDLNAIDYFDSEVFDSLPHEIKTFMLNTSVVKRFNAEVAKALTDNINVHEVLEYLQRQHLFVVQFNEPQQWFRYHHLLRDFLRHKLLIQSSNEIKTLHLKASEVFLKLGYIVGAVDHAIRSQDPSQITKILVDYGEELIHKAHYDVVKDCFAELPDDVIAANAKLTLVYCWVEAVYGDAKKVEQMLSLAEPKILNNAREADASLRAEFESVRAQALYSLGNLTAAEQAADRALKHFPQDNTRRQSPLLIYANVKYDQGELDRALAIYEESELLSRQESNHDAVLWSLVQQSQIWKQRCDFETATKLTHEVQEYAELNGVNNGFNLCFALLNQSEMALEAYHLREARLLINQVGILCKSWDDFWSQHLFGWLLKIEILKGKPTVAREFSLQHEGVLARESVAEHIISYSIEVQLLYWWQSGEIKKIETWLNATPKVIRCDSLKDFTLFRAQLCGHVACGRLTEAMTQLDSVYSQLKTVEGRPFLLEFIRLGLLRVVILSLQSKPEEAKNELLELLPLLQQFSIVASILYLRQWLMPVVEQLKEDDLSEEQARFVEQLLILYKQRSTSGRRGGDEVPDGLLAMGVSKKEWRVLRYIIEGKSNDDIANTMFIAVSTVKTHINNLYKKMAVANRKEAIEMGKELSAVS